MSALRVKDEEEQKLMLHEPLIVDVWGEDNVKEFYAVYPRIRHGYNDGQAVFYPRNEFGDLARFRAAFLENIKCCTYNAAKILRREKEFGSIRQSMSEDLFIVEGNPANIISETRKVKRVFLRGKQVNRETC